MGRIAQGRAEGNQEVLATAPGLTGDESTRAIWDFSRIPVRPSPHGGGGTEFGNLPVTRPDDPVEVEATRDAAAAIAGRPPTITGTGVAVPTSQPTGGESLSPDVRAFFEERFNHPFAHVRIHDDAVAARNAHALGAHALTHGPHLHFAAGAFQPNTRDGRELIAHELAHVVQHDRNPGRPPVVARRTRLERLSQWYDQNKWNVYRGLIGALKAAKSAQVRVMRVGVAQLSGRWQSAAGTVVDVVDLCLDLCIQLLLAIIGLAVGFTEGIVGMVTGLMNFAYGLLKLTWDWLKSLAGFRTDYEEDVNAIIVAVKNIPTGLKAIFDAWLARYRKATLEEQVLMGGELVGQVEAFIATFAFAGAKAGKATTLTVPVRQLAPVLASAEVLTIPAVVPKTLAEGAVLSAQMMKMSGQGPGGPGPTSATDSGGGGGGGKGPLADATEQELDEAVRGMKPAGTPVKLGPHAAATKNRKALGVLGKDVQSAHGLPQAVGEGIPGYNPRHALTRLMETATHTGMDAYWKQQFMAMRAAGRTQATAREIFEIVAESIRRAPGIDADEKASLIARLSDEMFVENRLADSQLLDLPYPNIGP